MSLYFYTTVAQLDAYVENGLPVHVSVYEEAWGSWDARIRIPALARTESYEAFCSRFPDRDKVNPNAVFTLGFLPPDCFEAVEILDEGTWKAKE